MNIAKSEQIYLGVTIQSNLKWKSHVLSITAPPKIYWYWPDTDTDTRIGVALHLLVGK